jgi:hypothetical protein
MMKFVLVLGIAVLPLLTAGCGGGGQPNMQSTGDATKASPDQTTTEAAMFSKDVQPIFTSKCALSDCHGADKSAGMQLSAGVAYDNIVNVMSSEDPQLMRVMPSDPDNSYLVMKVEGRQKVGARMPLTGGPLSDTQIQAIRSWVKAGAKND